MTARTSGLPSTLHAALRASPVRYVLTGAGLFAVDLAVFLLLVRLLDASPAVAQAVSRSLGAALGFVAHRTFTFATDRHDRSVAAQGAGYIAGTVLNLLLSPLLVAGLVHLSGGWLVGPKLLAEVVMICWTYVLLRWIFRARGEDA